MRARSVNEVQNFERGQNPKKSLGIGGIDLYSELEERLDDLDMVIGMETMTAGEKWREYLEKALVGKTISAKMRKLPAFNSKKGENTGKYEHKDFTIKVADIKDTEEFRELYNKYKMAGFGHQIVLADEENNIYSLALRVGEKIHID